MEGIKMIEETKDEQKRVVIKIEGIATYSEKPQTDQVEAFDNFVNNLFEKYQETLHREFEAAGELGYEEKDEKSNEMIDPYLKSFSFDVVTKDVQPNQ